MNIAGSPRIVAAADVVREVNGAGIGREREIAVGTNPSDFDNDGQRHALPGMVQRTDLNGNLFEIRPPVAGTLIDGPGHCMTANEDSGCAFRLVRGPEMGAEDGEIGSLIVFSARDWARLNIGKEHPWRAGG